MSSTCFSFHRHFNQFTMCANFSFFLTNVVCSKKTKKKKNQQQQKEKTKIMIRPSRLESISCIEARVIAKAVFMQSNFFPVIFQVTRRREQGNELLHTLIFCPLFAIKRISRTRLVFENLL